MTHRRAVTQQAGADDSWWLLGGIDSGDAMGVYQPIGAASLAASYINLANPGTNDAAPGSAPTFSSSTGWGCSSSWLTTGLTPATDQTWSMFVRYTGATQNRNPAGIYNGAAAQFVILPNWNGNYTLVANGGAAFDFSPTTAGVVGVAGNTQYVDGVAGVTAIGAWSGTAIGIYLCARNTSGSAGSYWEDNIQAVAIYSATLTGTQAGLVSDAMAAL